LQLLLSVCLLQLLFQFFLFVVSLRKFVSLNKLFGFDKTDASNVNEISGPKTLVQKVQQAKGATVRRIETKKQQTAKTEREVEEDKRIKEVAKQTKQIDRISSHMNLCQAIVTLCDVL
jgi:biopolymer transport protein ExbB/TolQ